MTEELKQNYKEFDEFWEKSMKENELLDRKIEIALIDLHNREKYIVANPHLYPQSVVQDCINSINYRESRKKV